MSKSITKYKPESNVLPYLFIGLALVVVVFLVLRNKQGNGLPAGKYTNAEEWEVKYSADGLPTKIVIHRNAVRS